MSDLWNSVRRSRPAIVRRRFLGASAGITAASAVLAACGGSSSNTKTSSSSSAQGATQAAATAGAKGTTAAQEQPKPGGTIAILGVDPSTGFDPQKTFSYRTQETSSFAYDRVLEFPVGPGTEPVDITVQPGLAEKWESPDKTTFIVHLRQNAKWWDKPPANGRAVTSEDITYTIQRMSDLKYSFANLFEGRVAKAETPDPQTVKFTLTSPFADFAVNLANYYVWIVNKENVEANGGDISKQSSVLGSGPFMIESYTPGQQVTFKKNPNYWKPNLPYVDRIVWYGTTEPATQESLLRSGTMDEANINLTDVDAVKKTTPSLQWQYWYTVGGDIIQWRCDKGWTKDVRVRQAIALAFDRKGWMKAFYLDHASENNGPPIPAGYKDWILPVDKLGDGAKYYKYDVAEAKKLMAAAGYPDGFEATIDATGAYGPAVLDRAQAFVKLMEQIGIKLKINVKEYGAWLNTDHAGQFDEFAFGLLTPVVSIDDWAYGGLHTGEFENKNHYSDPKMDALLEQQRAEYDTEARKKIIYQVQQYAAETVPTVWPPAGQVATAWYPYLKGYVPKGGYIQGQQLAVTWTTKSH